MQNALKNYKYDGRRTTILKAGTISFQGTSIECVVLNISVGGAGLAESDIAVPFIFDLEINGERIHRRCVLAWRNDGQIGVSFEFNLPTDHVG